MVDVFVFVVAYCVVRDLINKKYFLERNFAHFVDTFLSRIHCTPHCINLKEIPPE